MSKLIAFLLKLAAEEFYGDITISFRKGEVHWPVQQRTMFVEASLPLPDMNDPAIQKRLGEALGVPLS